MAQTQIIAEPGVPQLVISREFLAPRDLLFRAYIDPDLLRQWLGPRRMSMTIDRFDPRHGGMWRFVHSDADESDYGFHGVFHGDPSRERIVWTFEYEGLPGHISVDTTQIYLHADLALKEKNGMAGGKKIEFVKVSSDATPDKAVAATR